MRVAVTGGVAEGKSTVLQACADAGYTVGSADAVAREVFEQAAVQAQLAQLLQVEAPVAPSDLRQVLSENPSLRRSVNRLMHGNILQAMDRQDAQIWEVPLLIETCIYGLFDRVWVVTCGPEEQLERLVARLGDEQAARNLIATQLPSTIKCAFADHIVRTNQPRDLVQQDVLALLASELG
jgi:dephospho-CoA kinase